MAEDPNLHRTIPNDYDHYRRLLSEHREIRLLRICPGGHGLVVSLVRCSLASHPPYRALSYCWGNLDELKPITVIFEDDGEVPYPSNSTGAGARGVVFQITTNLHDALESFRRSKESGYLWIDMLCINQGDIDERSGQVRFMRSIYASAESVIVWLGTDPRLRESIFAPENYEIALAHLMLEELGWQTDDFAEFVSENVEELRSRMMESRCRENFQLGEPSGGGSVPPPLAYRRPLQISRTTMTGMIQPVVPHLQPSWRRPNPCSTSFRSPNGQKESGKSVMRYENSASCYFGGLMVGTRRSPLASASQSAITVLGLWLLAPRYGSGAILF